MAPRGLSHGDTLRTKLIPLKVAPDFGNSQIIGSNFLSANVSTFAKRRQTVSGVSIPINSDICIF